MWSRLLGAQLLLCIVQIHICALVDVCATTKDFWKGRPDAEMQALHRARCARARHALKRKLEEETNNGEQRRLELLKMKDAQKAKWNANAEGHTCKQRVYFLGENVVVVRSHGV